VQLRASDVVAIYKCPNCGELAAPVKPKGQALKFGDDSQEIKRPREK
jgi:hypothetical protein